MPKTEAQRIAQRAYYERHREESAARQRAWEAANREQVAAAQRAYREVNREKLLAQGREYQRTRRTADPEKMRARAKAAKDKVQAETRPQAGRWGYPWTGPELEIAARTGLTARQVALMIGRTAGAVRLVREKLRHEPKFQMLAGLTDAQRADMGMTGKQVSHG